MAKKLKRPCQDQAIAVMLSCHQNGTCTHGVPPGPCTRIDEVRDEYVKTGGNIHLMSGKTGCEFVVNLLKKFPGSKIICVSKK